MNGVIEVYCCQCGRFIRCKDGDGVSGRSHTWCEECFEQYLTQWAAELGISDSKGPTPDSDATAANAAG